MPKPKKTDDPKPFLQFDSFQASNSVYNIQYIPRLREGGLTPEVINSGNLTVLKNFQAQHQGTLTPEEQKYLDARISAAEEFQRLKEKKIRDFVENKQPQLMENDTKNGYTGFSTLKLPEEGQTSNNGCWSCAYSLLLKSRGIDLSQEKIRAWRPDYPAGSSGTSPANPDLTYRRNFDTTMNMTDNADMIAEILPNTALNTMTIHPFSPHAISVITDPNDPSKNRSPTRNEAQKLEEAHRNYVKDRLLDTIKRAIITEKSPVCLVKDDHYVTITGIDLKTNMLRCQDSKGEKREDFFHIDEIVNATKTTFTGKNQNYESTSGKPIALTWLKTIKTPTYDKNGQMQPNFGLDHQIMHSDLHGNTRPTIPMDDPFYVATGKYEEGQVETSGISRSVGLDPINVFPKKKKKFIGSGPNKTLLVAQVETKYPKKLLFRNDPELQALYTSLPKEQPVVQQQNVVQQPVRPAVPPVNRQPVQTASTRTANTTTQTDSPQTTAASPSQATTETTPQTTTRTQVQDPPNTAPLSEQTNLTEATSRTKNPFRKLTKEFSDMKLPNSTLIKKRNTLVKQLTEFNASIEDYADDAKHKNAAEALVKQRDVEKKLKKTMAVMEEQFTSKALMQKGASQYKQTVWKAMSFLEKSKQVLKTNQIQLEQKAESEKASKKRSADRQKRVERRLRDAAKRYNGQEGTLKIYTKMQIDALKTLQKTAFKQGSDALNADEKETVADALAALIVHKKYANSAAVNQSNRNTRQRIPSTKEALENEIQAVRSSRGFAEVTKKLKRSHLQNLAASDEAARKFFEEYSAKQKEFTRGRGRTL